MIVKFFKRPPDVIIGTADDPYLHRWHIIPRNRLFNIYLHHFMRSDDDRALHDHPGPSIRILLSGSYIEHFKDGTKFRMPGDIIFMSAKTAHRIELIPLGGLNHEKPVWTIFCPFFKYREWGFHCPERWRHWSEFTKPGNQGEIGKGCD